MTIFKSWLAVSLYAALAAMGLAALVPFLPNNQAVVLLALGTTAFLFVLYMNPAWRYWRLASGIAACWLTAHAIPGGMLKLGWNNDNFVDLRIDQELSWTFDLMAMVLVVFLALLDFISNAETNGLTKLCTTIVAAIRRYATKRGDTPGQRAQIGNVTGNNNQISINQSLEVPATSLDKILAANPFDANAQIDKAVAYLKEGKAEIATEHLIDLKKRYWDRLSPREKYRLTANLGHASDAVDAGASGAKYHIEARLYQPDDEKAMAMEAHAYLMLGEFEKALKKSQDVLNIYPLSEIATVVRLQSTPQPASFRELAESVPLPLRDNENVRFALSVLAAQQDEFDQAERLARLVLLQDAGNPKIIAWLGKVIVAAETEKSKGNDGATDKTRLDESIELLTRAMTILTSNRSRALARYSLAQAFRLRGRVDDAEAEFYAASRELSSEQDFVASYAMFLYERGKIESAVKVLLEAICVGTPVKNRLLLARLLGERAGPQDLENGYSILHCSLAESVSLAPQLRADVAETLMKMLAKQGLALQALELLEALPKDYLTAPVAHGFRARSLLRLDRRVEADTEAEHAIRSLIVESDQYESIIVAEMLTILDRHSDATKIWKSLPLVELPLEHAMAAINSAEASGDHDFIISGCRLLREHGVVTQFSAELEVHTLQKYGEHDQAIRLMDIHIAKKPESELAKTFRVRKSLFGIRCNKPELIESDPSKLPEAKSVTVELGGTTAFVLSRGKNPAEGRHYAYELLRLHFDNPEAQKAYLKVFSIHDMVNDSSAIHESVVAGSAVSYRELNSGEVKWIVVEDGQSPRVDRGEYSPGHQTSIELLGKRIGDEFYIRRDPIQDRKGRIEGIVSKYAFRFRYILETWEEHFPGEFLVRQYSLPKQADGTLDVSSIFQSLDIHQEHLKGVLELYRDHPFSVAILAKLQGDGFIETLFRVLREGTLPIRCCSGSEAELRGTEISVVDVDTFVIDKSALATLYFSGVFRCISELPVKCVVVRSSLDEFYELHRSLESPSQGFDFAGNGKYFLREDNPASRQSAREKLSEFFSKIMESVAIESGLELANVDPKIRSELIDRLGKSQAEAIAAASKPGRAIWTDDIGVAVFGRERLQVKRVWSHFVFRRYLGNGPSTRIDYLNLTICLIGWRYQFTWIEVEAIVLAAERANWNEESEPFCHFLRWISDKQITSEQLAVLCLHVFSEVWLKAPLFNQRCQVVRAIVGAVLRLPDGKKIALAIAQLLAVTFRLDVVGAEQCRQCVMETIRGVRPSGIILPRSL